MFATNKFAAGCWLTAGLLTACSPGWDDGVDKDAAATETKGDASTLGTDTGHATAHAGPDGGAVGAGPDAQTPPLTAAKPDAAVESSDAAAVVASNDAGPVTMNPPVDMPVMPTMAELCKVCDAHATCAVSGSQALCSCQSGYLGDGKTCRPEPTCATLSCGANSTCVADGAGAVSCACKAGYELKANGQCGDINECGAAVNPCAGYPSTPFCLNTDGGSMCQCTPPGMAPNLVQNGDFSLPGTLAPWGPRGAASTATWALPGAAQIVAGPSPYFNDLLQALPIAAGATYSLSALVSTSTSGQPTTRNCAFGIRLNASTTSYGEGYFSPNEGVHTVKSTVVIPSDARDLQLYFGCWPSDDGTGSTTLVLDEVKLTQQSGLGICAN